MGMDIYDFYIKFASNTNSFYQKRLRDLKFRHNEAKIQLYKLLPDFQKSQQEYIVELDAMIMAYKNEKYGDIVELEIEETKEIIDDVDVEWFRELLLYSDNTYDVDCIVNTYDAYIELYMCSLEMECMKDVLLWINHLMQKQASNGNEKPAFINDKQEKKDFRKMLSEKMKNKKKKISTVSKSRRIIFNKN